MKLKNKLLPIFGIAAATATVVPLVTSCKLSKMDMIDITKGYYPKTKASIAGKLTQQQATQTYINDVKTNSEIFKQDFLYGVYTKVNKLGREFQNIPSETQSYLLSAAKFKINSLKAGLTNPSFSHTTIYYPEEPSVTYPTVSFEYTIQLKYTYEYLAYNYSEAYGDEGFHSRTNNMEIHVKYSNVPFLAVAHSDLASKTYWQVTPIDTIAIDSLASTNYYNQAYMFEYMDDAWSINISSTINGTEKYKLSGGDSGTTKSNATINKKISTWNQLKQYVENTSTSVYDDDVVGYEEMLISQVNWGFESWYLQNVDQKPELQTTGGMTHTVTDYSITSSTCNIYSFYLPQTFDGDIEFYSDYDEATKTLSGDIVLENISSDDAEMTITITAGTKLTIGENANYIEGASYKLVTEPTAGFKDSYNFKLPKYIYAEFIPSSGEAWVQQVYLNQDSLGAALNE